jgi:hypothetical protein
MIVMLQRKFSIFFDFCFILFPLIVYSTENVPIQSDNSVPVNGPNNTDLYNAMIYPFTRTVIYGAIWYQGKAREVRYF